MKIRIALLLLLPFVLLFSCSAQQPLAEVQLNPNTRLLLLDSTESADAITRDRYDGFFEKITAAEISIQMHRPLREGETSETMKGDYLGFLRSDVEGFTAKEAEFVASVMEHVFKTIESVSKDIFPKDLKLVKTKGRHYGDGVYYTRENCIVIPKNELENRDRKAFTTTMFHEVFHIYSRLNEKKRDQLYGLIGFENIGFEKLILPENLAARALFNPDGVDFAQKISLQTKNGQAIEAVPIIYANETGFKPEKSEFFGYLEFNLFEVRPEGNRWKVVTAADGFSSNLNLRDLPDFFRQIRDNTHYIIHPDEVLADNFAFLMQSKNDPAVTAKFSEPGKNLIKEIEKIITSGAEGRTPSVGSNR